MSREIYNEGRTAGYSAYEMYVRQFLSVNPNGTPATEKEWLASSIASGASLLAYIPKDTQTYLNEEFHTVDITLPLNTSLRAANTIIGSWTNIVPKIVVPPFEPYTYYHCDGYYEIPQMESTPAFIYGKHFKGEIYSIPQFNYVIDFIPDKFYQFTGSNFVKLSTKPADWETNYTDYFYISYTLLLEKPADWETNYTDYYRLRYATPLNEPSNWSTTYNQYYIYNAEEDSYKLIPIEYECITDYSSALIPNNDEIHPPITANSVDTTKYPTNAPTLLDLGSWTDDTSYNDYLKIVDGVILQDGEWETWGDSPSTSEPYLKFTPNLSKSPVLRILIRGTITQGTYIMLTGFTDNGVLFGSTGINSSIETSNPQNGDFLGPATYPWANKVIFNISNGILDMIYRNVQDINLVDSQNITFPSGSTAVKLSDITRVLNIPNAAYETNASGNGYINWGQLFVALSNDTKIKIVSDILLSLSDDLTLPATDDYTIATGKGLKIGKNYIDFNGIRLYVSNTEPVQTYTPLSIEPTDWSTTYTNYYRYDSGTDTYTPVTDVTAPQFVANTFYSADIPNGSIGIGWTTA